jgi:hypothetical protein
MRQRRRAAVERAHLRQGERIDVLAHVRELGVARCDGRGVGALGAGYPPVVSDHGLPILGDLHVQLQGADPQLQRVAERRQRVLHPQPDAATVRLQVERLAFAVRHRRGRHAEQQARCQDDRSFPQHGWSAPPPNAARTEAPGEILTNFNGRKPGSVRPSADRAFGVCAAGAHPGYRPVGIQPVRTASCANSRRSSGHDAAASRFDCGSDQRNGKQQRGGPPGTGEEIRGCRRGEGPCLPASQNRRTPAGRRPVRPLATMPPGARHARLFGVGQIDRKGM